MSIQQGLRKTLAPIELDPFSYFPNVSSRFAGLGGSDERPELSYGFHTHYVHCAPGHCHIHLKVDGLAASSGLLYLQIHMLSDRPGSHASIATIERVPLLELIAAGGEASVRFESIKGMKYAVYGRVVDVTDARASGLTLTLDRPGSDDQDMAVEPEATSLGRFSSLGVERLISSDPPMLANPVSQICTSSQFLEPTFVQWCEILGEPVTPSLKLWQQVFLLQALDRYGFLQHGARLMGLGGFDTALPAMFAKRGVHLLIGHHAPVDETLREWLKLKSTVMQRGHIADSETMTRQVHIQPVYIPAPHSSLGQFDGCWSFNILNDMSTGYARREFIENCLERVHPGGIAIHLFGLEASVSHGDVSALLQDQVSQRNQIESLALNMISHGHEVAQLRFNFGNIYSDPSGRSAFGLIIRRSLKS